MPGWAGPHRTACASPLTTCTTLPFLDLQLPFHRLSLTVHCLFTAFRFRAADGHPPPFRCPHARCVADGDDYCSLDPLGTILRSFVPILYLSSPLVHLSPFFRAHDEPALEGVLRQAVGRRVTATSVRRSSSVGRTMQWLVGQPPPIAHVAPCPSHFNHRTMGSDRAAAGPVCLFCLLCSLCCLPLLLVCLCVLAPSICLCCLSRLRTRLSCLLLLGPSE